jgi:DNA primase
MNNTIQQIKHLYPAMKIVEVALPEGHSLNDMLVNYGPESIPQHISDARAVSDTTAASKIDAVINSVANYPVKDATELKDDRALDKSNPRKLVFRTPHANYIADSELGFDNTCMRIVLCVEQLATKRKETRKIDLFEPKEINELAQRVYERMGLDTDLVITDLSKLTDLLSDHREKEQTNYLPESMQKHEPRHMAPARERECLEFLKEPNLLDRMDTLLEKAGIVGEEELRKLVWVVASSYKFEPLHCILQGVTGSGKSHVLNTIAECCPQEDVLSLSHITAKSLHNYGPDALMYKLMVIQDVDGIEAKSVIYAIRELQTSGCLRSSTTMKDRFGNVNGAIKTVNGHFASLMATTKGAIYEDNESRSLVCGVNDQNEEARKKIVAYCNRKTSGLIDPDAERRAKEFFQDCIRCLHGYVVVNRYADKIELPIKGAVLLRLNNQFQAFVKQITILHQHQRKKDDLGRLIAEPEDIRLACEIMFNAIVVKADELDSSLRTFFERLKTYVRKKNDGERSTFYRKEVRQALNISDATLHRFIEKLIRLEYLFVKSGHANIGFEYGISDFDDNQKMRKSIKQNISEQLDRLA